MTKNESCICTQGKIWELHIHSNQCFSADKELKKLSIPDYVTSLLEVLDGYEDLEMISFTDHNHICFDLYKEFINRDSRFVLLPGIEIDVCLFPNGEKKDSKHVVAYFDAADDIDKIEKLSKEINEFVAKNHIGVQKDEKPIYIHELLDKLISLNVQFVLSPHAMKQTNRDIDADWHAMEDAERKGDIKKYLDQFFCFWESSGARQIHYASDFLREMDCGERVSIVAFSDSKDFNKLKQYLDNPCQYFNSLPNFNGLKMAGSEISRITREQYCTESIELGSYIGTILFENQKIELTPRLNAIIGGRGSGKSVLLDSLAIYLGQSECLLDKTRADFIKQFQVNLKSMSGTIINPGQFRFDYYNQNYIAKLFEKQGDEFNAELEKYFSSAFLNIEKIEVSAIKRSNEEAFEALLGDFQTAELSNLEGFVEKYVLDNKDVLNINILDKNKKKVEAKLTDYSYDDTIAALRKAINPKIPSFLRDDEDVKQAIEDLCFVVCQRAYAARTRYLEGDYLFNTITDTFKQKKASISKAQKDRLEAIELFKDIFEEKCVGYRKRVALINALAATCEEFESHYEKPYYARGERDRAFLFKRELEVEHPLDYMVRLMSLQISSRDIGPCNRSNLWAYIQRFCFDKNCYKQGFSSETLYDALSSYDLQYEERLSINYLRDNGKYEDISTLSPGTQTNILIEYIVHQETRNPLFIDQPEDNVDNQTIYGEIKRWFMTLKKARQVIVVTHDANIVINADADNIILATHNNDGSFTYKHGALEHEDVLENASLILDGGKEAVRRRLVKYGE